MNELISWDYKLLYYINELCANPFFDYLLPLWRDKYFWAPVYLFLLSFIAINYPRKQVWWLMLGLLATVILSDQISASVIKPLADRLRPCRNPDLLEYIRVLVPCGSGKSFVSSHATNHFAFSTFIAVIWGRLAWFITPLAMFWAFTVCFAQVYVGVHFPLDVICGGILGHIIGFVVAKAVLFAVSKYASTTYM
ncbi:MAG: phosphatase PAP2 family protein [Chitinophagales bacterium]|nr:phosphatase PAP2 family protein [Chitinophagales bacterium]